MPSQQQDPPWPAAPMPEPLMDWIGDLYDWLKDNRPVEGLGTYLTDAPGRGKAINAGTASGGAPPPFTPFQLVDASESGAPKIRVVYGTVNGTAPDGMSFGDTPPYIVSVSGSGSIYLEITTDTGGTITDRSIGVGSLPADSTGLYHHEIGSFSITGVTLSIAQSISGSQEFELCGGVTPLWGLT